MDDTTDSSRQPLFYGWRVVGAVFITLVTGSGLAFYNLSVLLAALTTEKGFTLAAASAAPSLFFLSGGFSGIGIALFIERYDVRVSVTIGAGICACALIWIGRVSELWQLYAAFILFGMGFAAAGLLPGTTLVTRWFARQRAMALALATTGLSVGGACLTPLSAWLILTLGLEQATLWLAALYVLGVVPVTLLFTRSHPRALRSSYPLLHQVR